MSFLSPGTSGNTSVSHGASAGASSCCWQWDANEENQVRAFEEVSAEVVVLGSAHTLFNKQHQNGRTIADFKFT